MNEEQMTQFINSMTILINDGYEIFLFHQGLGETCTFCLLMKSYREFSNKKIMVITMNEARTQLLQQCPFIDDVFQVNPQVYHTLASTPSFLKQFNIKDFLTLHYIPRDVNIVKTTRDEICYYLGMPLDYPFYKYQLSSKTSNSIETMLMQNGFEKGKTILLVPHALCFGDNVVPPQFWTILVDQLHSKGFRAIFNSDKTIVPQIPSIFLPITESVHLANYCGNVIGSRTGFLDVLSAFSSAKIQAIYPDDSNPIWETNPGLRNSNLPNVGKSLKYMKSWSLNKMFENDNAIEYVYNGIEMIDTLISHID